MNVSYVLIHLFDLVLLLWKDVLDFLLFLFFFLLVFNINASEKKASVFLFRIILNLCFLRLTVVLGSLLLIVILIHINRPSGLNGAAYCMGIIRRFNILVEFLDSNRPLL